MSRRMLATAGALALLLAIGVAVFLREKATQPAAADVMPGPLAVPRGGTDAVPTGPLIDKKDLPRECGVSRATVRALSPQADAEGQQEEPASSSQKECLWISNDRLPLRRLEVRIFVYRPPVGSAMSKAMAHIGGRPLGDSVPTPKPVSGLGEEANVIYPDDKGDLYEGALVRFRVSNAVVEARFGGSEGRRPNGDLQPISQRLAVRGAFRVAAETAKAMKTQARPRLAPAVKTAAPPAVRPPCALVSKRTLAKVAKGAGGEKITVPEFLIIRPETHEPDPSSPGQTCRWTASTPPDDTGATYHRQLQVTTFAFPSVAAAQRNFLISHYVMRDQSGADFRVLAGLGDRAVAGFGKDNVAMATFQRGHVVVTVLYAGNDKRVPMPRGQATNAAYTAALDVAAALTT